MVRKTTASFIIGGAFNLHNDKSRKKIDTVVRQFIMSMRRKNSKLANDFILELAD